MASSDYTLLAEVFDAAAPTYDQQFSAAANAIMRWMRSESHKVMLETFPRGGHLLDIGCGTGEDAITLAGQGFRILATDVSDEMRNIAQGKIVSAGLSDRITTRTSPAARISEVVGSLVFDGAYSNFGPLNCEPDLDAVAAALSDHLTPGAGFVCTVMAPICPIEVLWFGAHLQLGQAIRRWKGNLINARVGDTSVVATRYLSANALRRVFTPYFSMEQVMSLPLLLPPPYLEGIYERYHHVWARLEPIERVLRDRWPFNRMGDHLLFVMRRR